MAEVNECMQRGALSAAEVCEALGMSQLKGRKWHVQSAVAIRGEGLYEGLDWCALRLRSTWQAPSSLPAWRARRGNAAHLTETCLCVYGVYLSA